MKRITWIVTVLLLGIVGVLGFLKTRSNFSGNKAIVQSPKIKEEIFLSSPYKQLALYEEAFASASVTEKETIFAGITSHHFLAKDLIANFFQGINNSKVEQVILISPDHFNYTIHDQTLAHSSLLNWQTIFSILNSEQNLIKKLNEQSLITIKDTPFRNEHGIYTLIPFIKYYFPEAEVVPLILNPKKADSEFFDFGQIVKQEFDSSTTLLIISSDFSHGLSLEKTQQADLVSVETLNKLSLENLEKVNSDCQSCLAFLLGYLADESYQFKLIDNKTSAEFSKEKLETVTSYISGYFLP